MLKKILASRGRTFKTGTPGRRFRRQYYRRRESERGPLLRSLQFFGGVAIMLVGLFLMPAPGPGIVIFLLGGALAARESLLIARLLDAFELALRKLIRLTRRFWRKSSWWVRAPALLLVTAMLLGLMLVTWTFAPDQWKS